MNTIALHLIQAGKPQNVRLEVTLSKMNFYNVDKVLHVIAAALEPFECGQFCSCCDISDAHEKKRVDAQAYDCDGLRKRHCVLRDLCLRLTKLIDLGRFQVWDSEMRHAQEFPWSSVTPGLGYLQFKNWARSSFIFPDDLSVFLAVEKIRVNVVSYSTDSAGNVMVDLSGEEKRQYASATTMENASEESRAESMANMTPATPGHAAEVFRNRPQRFDHLAVEIDELLINDLTMTPTLVWHALTAKIGAGNTCIVSVTDVGLRWKNAKGDLVIASASNVADRVTRWKKSRK